MSGTTSTVPPRLDGVFNFRDLGGLPLVGGGVTAGGRLFRSDGLHRAPADHQRRLRDVPIAAVVDLRTTDEVEREGRVETDGVEWRHAPILQSLGDFVGGAAVDEDDDPLCRHYEHMVADNAEALTVALTAVADAVDHGPTVFHCTAGKDRTGVVAALILATAGVADDDVAADFARSRDGMARMIEWYRATTDTTPAERMAQMGVDPAMRDVLIGAEAATMQRFLDRLRRRSGGLAPYLSGIGAAEPVERIAARLRA